MEKGLTVSKWVLIVWSKTPQMPQNLSAQFVCPSPKVLHFNGKAISKRDFDLIQGNFKILTPLPT